MQLLVQEYLRSGKTLENLKIEHGVNYKIVDDRVSLSYNQIDSKETDKIACECRGLVLNTQTYDVIAFPFRRFFNLNDPNAAKIDWESAVYFDKLDGSLAIFYYYQNRWHVATRGVPDASGNVNNSNTTFAQLVDLTIVDMVKRVFPGGIEADTQEFMGTDQKQPDINTMMGCMELNYNLDVRDYTFCMELTGPYNRIVCDYPEKNLTLLGVRNNKTFEELDPEMFELNCYGLKVVQPFSFDNIDSMIEVIKTWNPSEKEGIVVRDKHFNRVKVKSPAYVAFNRLNQALQTSWRGCVEIILLEKDKDVLPMVPKAVAERILKLKPLIKQIINETELTYERIKHIDDMKVFAIEAQKTLWTAPLFAMKRGHISNVKEFLYHKSSDGNIPSTKLQTILEICQKMDPELKNIAVGGL